MYVSWTTDSGSPVPVIFGVASFVSTLSSIVGTGSASWSTFILPSTSSETFPAASVAVAVKGIFDLSVLSSAKGSVNWTL